MDLTSFLVLLAVMAFAVNLWADRRAADAATHAARQACERSGVLWLDQNVQRVRKRLARNDEGRLAWQRDFDFEFSTSGQERQLGRVTLLGVRVVGLIGPDRPPLVFVGPGGV